MMIFTRHLLIIEGDDDPVELGAHRHEADSEHGAPRGLHPGGDVVPRLRGHQDLQVTLASLRRVHCYERGLQSLVTHASIGDDKHRRCCQDVSEGRMQLLLVINFSVEHEKLC